MSAHASPAPLAAPMPPLGERVLGWIAEEWDQWPLWLPVAVALGILAYFQLPAEPGLAWLALPWPLLGAGLALRGPRPVVSAAILLVAAAALGFAAARFHSSAAAPMPELPRIAVVVTGRVAAADLLPEGRRLVLDGPRLDDGPALERQLRIRLRAGDPARPAPGDTVRIRALVRSPMAPAYPGAYDLQRAAFFSGLGGSGFALNPAAVIDRGEAPLFAGLRAGIEARIGDALPGATGAVAAALLTGSQSGIPAAELSALRDSGLAHLLSVSGLHVGIVTGLGFVTLRALIAAIPWLALRLDSKAAAALLGLAMGGAYTLLTGAGVPMLRAFAMAALATLAVLAGRRALSLRALALAAGLVLLANPAALVGPSFQMSFAAVLALIAMAQASRALLRALRLRGRAGRCSAMLLGLVATSVVAAAVTTPVGLHHFGRLQLYGVFANAIAVPLTSFLVMPAGMLALLLMPLGLEGPALAAMGWGVDATLWTGRAVAAWPGAALSAPPIPAWGLGLFALGLCWLCLWRLAWRWAGLPMMLLGLLSGMAARPPDILVAADGRMLAIATPSAVLTERASGANRITRESWLRSWGEDQAIPLPRDGEAADGLAQCGALSCLLRPRPEAAAAILLRRPPPDSPRPRRGPAPPPPPVLAETGCRQAAVMISLEPIRGRCRDTPGVDRFSVWRDGAHAIWLGPGGATILSDRAWRGNRPWVPPVPIPRAQPQAEPPAEVE
ncbi:ComEC/Rec2 family competence protein [Roseomonas sp. SSH11]|uniref:ComEC/Rec2 family competence protein n=1 Tax=Pararoseomonas baculiformis TaxID=2820812 RepID=A0ABS4AFB7_9PROT|nr:ComEC/Rec2 family competence protein [Pararoseomonas baculiformis]MBP0445709.1 ComEC/Rec2 family competence protein [Pararoseomonas baculiformis]